MKDHRGITATMAKGSTAGQSFTIDATCTNGNNTFSYFEISHQTPWDNTLTLRIYEGKDFNGTPRFTKRNITTSRVTTSTKIKIQLEGGDGDLSFENGKTYTFTITPEDHHFRWNGDRNNTNLSGEGLWPNNGGTWAGTFDYFYEVGTINTGISSSETQSQLDELYAKYPNITGKLKTIIDTYVKVEDLVVSGNYEEASSELTSLWNMYPKGDSSWDFQSNNNIWLGIPAAYNGLRALDDIVSSHASNSTCTNPISLNIKVVLVGKSTGIMPNNPVEMTTGNGIHKTKMIDARLRANNNELINDLLYVFSRYIEAATNGTVKPSIEIIELPNFEYPVTVKEEPHGKASAYGNPDPTNDDNTFPNIWSELTSEQKNSTDLWWIIYPSFVPGIGGNLQTTTPNFNNISFFTGGTATGPKGEAVLFVDDLFFLEKQLHIGGGSMTDIERRCYAATWFQHEYFHYLFDVFPNEELEEESHIWFQRDKWPNEFEGMFEADYFHEAMDKRLSIVENGPLVNRIIIRRDAVPSDVFSKLDQSDLEGDYSALVPVNKYNRFSIKKKLGSTNKYIWKNEVPLEYEMDLRLNEGIFSNAPGGYDARLQLKYDENTCAFVTEVIGIRHGKGLIIKK